MGEAVARGASPESKLQNQTKENNGVSDER